MLAQKCTGAFIICHNMSIKGARKRPDMRILCRIARGSEASRNPLESLQRRTEAGGDCERKRSEPQSVGIITEKDRSRQDCERERSEPQSVGIITEKDRSR